MVFGKKDATARKSFNLPFVANDFLEKASAVDGITQTDLITKLSMSAQIQLKAGFYLGEDKKGTPECISNIFEFYQQQRGGEMTCSKTCELIEYFVTYVFPNVNFIDEKLSNNLDYIKSNLKATLKIASPLAKLQGLVQMSENFDAQSIKELALLIKTNIDLPEYFANQYLMRIFVVLLRDCAEWKDRVNSSHLYPAGKPVIEYLFPLGVNA